MKPKPVHNYFLNCFLLMIPIMIWNLAVTNQLPKSFQPELFWNGIPIWLTYGENGTRLFIFALTLLMPLRFSGSIQKKGFFLYLAGILIYFASWLALIYFPTSSWSTSLPGFMAPAYTPLLWLTGIGLMGNSFYFNWPFSRWIFLICSVFFLAFHNFHTYTVYCRIQ